MNPLQVFGISLLFSGIYSHFETKNCKDNCISSSDTKDELVNCNNQCSKKKLFDFIVIFLALSAIILVPMAIFNNDEINIIAKIIISVFYIGAFGFITLNFLEII